jgi:hypothetical protein
MVRSDVAGGERDGQSCLIALIATDTQSPAVMITVGAWALPRGTLIVEALRARRLARTTLDSRDVAGPQPTNRQQ